MLRNKVLLIAVAILILLAVVLLWPFPAAYAAVTTYFSAAGDWGCTSNTTPVVSMINGQNPAAVLAAGDLSYSSSADCWFAVVAPIDDVMNIAIGNHDSSKRSTYLSHYGLANSYYSFNEGNVHFISMDSEMSYGIGSTQYNFVRDDLIAASTNPAIDWIVAFYHKPAYTSSTNHAATTALRDTFHPLFDQYDVDMVIQAHNHNYQRSYPLEYNSGSPSSPTIKSTNPNSYTDVNGVVYMIVGTGGQSLYSINGQASFTAHQFQDTYGAFFATVSVDDSGNDILNGKFLTNGGSTRDTFTITKTGGGPPPTGPTTVINNPTPGEVLSTSNWAVSGSVSPGATLVEVSLNGSTYQPALIIGGTGWNIDYTGQADGNYVAEARASDGTTTGPTVTRSFSVNTGAPPVGGYHYEPFFTATGSNSDSTSNSAALQVSQFTLAAWFKNSVDKTQAYTFIATKGGIGSDSSGKNMNYGLWLDSSERVRGGFETASGGSDVFINGISEYRDGQWHYATLTYNGSVLNLYVDGALVAFKSQSTGPETNGTGPVRVAGNAHTSGGYFFTGSIDEVRLWNRGMSASEIAAQFNDGNFNIAGQVIHKAY